MCDKAGGNRRRRTGLLRFGGMGPRCNDRSRRTRGNCPNRDRGSDSGSRDSIDTPPNRIPGVLEKGSRAGLGHRAGVAGMLVGNSSPDAASRAAIRVLMDWLPGRSVVEGSTDLDLSARADQPQLISANIVEGKTL